MQPLRKDLVVYLQKRSLINKWVRASTLFLEDHRHPSLHFELLEPKWRGIYSFRIDKKYRALFFLNKNGMAEIFAITNHYKK